MKDYAKMRERGSGGDWFAVEFLANYDQNQLRAFGYIRRQDGGEIHDGDYEVLEGLDERRSRWKKSGGKWQVKWRHRWSKER